MVTNASMINTTVDTTLPDCPINAEGLIGLCFGLLGLAFLAFIGGMFYGFHVADETLKEQQKKEQEQPREQLEWVDTTHMPGVKVLCKMVSGQGKEMGEGKGGKMDEV